MIVAGCDVGSLTAKAVILENGRMLAGAVRRVAAHPSASAEAVMRAALASAGLDMGDLAWVVGTGYGRERIAFAGGMESEISCHARGAWKIRPSVRTVIDIGGQDAKVTRVDENGKVVRYQYNDKCASGSGRFLEVMADALEVPLEEMGAAGARSREKLSLSSQCVIFAETEVISLVNAGKEPGDIVAALHRALGQRVAALARSVEVAPEVVMTGGVARNAGVFQALSEALQVPLKPLEGVDPQIVGALGAALFAPALAAAAGKEV